MLVLNLTFPLQPRPAHITLLSSAALSNASLQAGVTWAAVDVGVAGHVLAGSAIDVAMRASGVSVLASIAAVPTTNFTQALAALHSATILDRNWFDMRKF